MDDGDRMPEWELKGNTVIISGTGAFEQQMGSTFGNAKDVKVVVEEGLPVCHMVFCREIIV